MFGLSRFLGQCHTHPLVANFVRCKLTTGRKTSLGMLYLVELGFWRWNWVSCV